jgi:hypothetical protein
MNRSLAPKTALLVGLAWIGACSTAPIEQGEENPPPTVPSNVTPPAVSGTVQEGQLLITTDGSWSGTTPITYSIQWKRCNPAGASCVDIPGATASTHLLLAADVGATIRSSITGTNTAGSSGSTSAQTGVVAPATIPPTAPANTGAPVVTGSAQEGQTLTTTNGTWSGTTPMTYARQWLRCNSGGGACATISGATGTTYLLVTADVGSTIRSSVTATNGGGSATGQSSATGVVAAFTPTPGSCPVLASPPPGYCTGQTYVVTPSNRAIPTLQPGDVVVFENGTYTDTDADGVVQQISQGGSATNYVTFVSRNKWGAKIDGQNNSTRYGFNFAAVSYVRIDGFDIFGMGSNFAGTVAAPSASGIMLQAGGAFSQIVGNRIHNISNFCNPTIRAQTAIFLQKSNVLVEGNVIHDVGRFDPGENGCTYDAGFSKYKNSDTGLYVQSPGHSNHVIRNNVFYNHKNGWAIFFYQGGPQNVKILNNTFAFGNPYLSQSHIFTDADLIDFQIRNNVFYDPAGGYAIAWDLEPLVNVVITNNVASGQLLVSGANGAPITTLPAGMSENNNRFATNPLLVNAATFDFRLQAGSPAIDWGMALTDVTHDIDRVARPVGAGHDAGAYEFSPGSGARSPQRW